MNRLVLGPGDLVVTGRGRQHVEISVAIDVGLDHGGGFDRLDRHDARDERPGPVLVLVPSDLVRVADDDIRIAVPVHVGGVDRVDDLARADARPELEIAGPLDVLVPVEKPVGAVAARDATGQQIDIPVEIEIGTEHRADALGARDEVGAPDESLVLVEPVLLYDQLGEAADEDVHVAVVVRIGGKDRLVLVGRVDHGLGDLIVETGEQGQPRARAFRGGGDVRAAVPIDVAGEELSDLLQGDLCTEAERPAALVAVPIGRSGLGTGHDVELAVPVDVGRHDRRGSRGHGDDLCRAEVALAVQVLVPGDLVVARGGREHVRVAIAVEVRGEHRARAVGIQIDRSLGTVTTGGLKLAEGDVVDGDLVGQAEAGEIRRVDDDLQCRRLQRDGKVDIGVRARGDRHVRSLVEHVPVAVLDAHRGDRRIGRKGAVRGGQVEAAERHQPAGVGCERDLERRRAVLVVEHLAQIAVARGDESRIGAGRTVVDDDVRGEAARLAVGESVLLRAGHAVAVALVDRLTLAELVVEGELRPPGRGNDEHRCEGTQTDRFTNHTHPFHSRRLHGSPPRRRTPTFSRAARSSCSSIGWETASTPFRSTLANGIYIPGFHRFETYFWQKLKIGDLKEIEQRG